MEKYIIQVKRKDDLNWIEISSADNFYDANRLFKLYSNEGLSVRVLEHTILINSEGR